MFPDFKWLNFRSTLDLFSLLKNSFCFSGRIVDDPSKCFEHPTSTLTSTSTVSEMSTQLGQEKRRARKTALWPLPQGYLNQIIFIDTVPLVVYMVFFCGNVYLRRAVVTSFCVQFEKVGHGFLQEAKVPSTVISTPFC